MILTTITNDSVNAHAEKIKSCLKTCTSHDHIESVRSMLETFDTMYSNSTHKACAAYEYSVISKMIKEKSIVTLHYDEALIS